MARFTITVQFSDRPKTDYETDDINQADSIVKREKKKAENRTSTINAIFVNNRLKWGRRS